jgi:chemotaxis protein CheD
MRQVIVGISDCQLSRDPEEVLVTYALGSCVAVMVYDPEVRVGGLLHLMLPDSTIDLERGHQRPFMFADTGVPLLFRQSYELGADKRRMIVRIAGGAQMMDERGVFDIGRRNQVAVRKILWKAGVMIESEAVGGNLSRTVRLEMSAGTVWVRGPGGNEEAMGKTPRPSRGNVYGVPCADRG